MEKTEGIEAYDAYRVKEKSRYIFEDAGTEKYRRFTKPYVLYCIMTLSVMLFALAFAASELFLLFFSEGYPGQMLMSKFFGFSGTDEKSFEELLIESSFADLSFANGKNGSSSESTTGDCPDKTPDKTPDTPTKKRTLRIRPRPRRRLT